MLLLHSMSHRKTQRWMCNSTVFLIKTILYVKRYARAKLNEPHCEKTGFLHMRKKTKTQISFAVTAKMISAFVFTTRIEQFLYFLIPKFQVSIHLLWLYSPVCVGLARKPECWFSHDADQITIYYFMLPLNNQLFKNTKRDSAIVQNDRVKSLYIKQIA